MDLPVFDKKIVGIQKKAFEAAETFLRSHHAVCAEFQGPGIPTITTTSDGAAGKYIEVTELSLVSLYASICLDPTPLGWPQFPPAVSNG